MYDLMLASLVVHFFTFFFSVAVHSFDCAPMEPVVNLDPTKVPPHYAMDQVLICIHEQVSSHVYNHHTENGK